VLRRSQQAGIMVSEEEKMPSLSFSAVLHREQDLYVAECPEIGTVSQGRTVEEALVNLKESTELYREEFPVPERALTPGRERGRG
jgi:predicted RNase H-like HicB family nuclease